MHGMEHIKWKEELMRNIYTDDKMVFVLLKKFQLKIKAWVEKIKRFVLLQFPI